MNRIRFLVLTLALSGCAMPLLPKPPEAAPAKQQSAAAHSAWTLPPPVVDMPEESASSRPKTTIGSLLERAADGGILEIGLSDAPTLIVFTNYSCDYCAQFMTEDFSRLLREYVDPGFLKVRIVSVPFQKYATSNGEAAALLCATAKAKGMQMHGKLLTTAKRDRAGLVQIGTSLKITAKELGGCLDAQTTKDQLAIQQALIDQYGVTLVPAFVINGEKRVGLHAYPELRGWIDQEIAGTR